MYPMTVRETLGRVGEPSFFDLVVEAVPAWRSNRLKRPVHQPKRYLIDPALIAGALGADVAGMMRDGDLLGRVFDTIVAAPTCTLWG
jgi:hypothetical protein